MALAVCLVFVENEPCERNRVSTQRACPPALDNSAFQRGVHEFAAKVGYECYPNNGGFPGVAATAIEIVSAPRRPPARREPFMDLSRNLKIDSVSRLHP